MSSHTTIYNCLSSGDLDLAEGKGDIFAWVVTLKPGDCYRMKPVNQYDTWDLRIKGPDSQRKVVYNEKLVLHSELRVIDVNGGWDVVLCPHMGGEGADRDACPRGAPHRLYRWASCKR